MRETYQNILNVVVIIFIIGSSVLLFSQQKAISRLTGSQGSNNMASSAIKANTALIDRDQKKSESTVNTISGKLVSVSGNVLTVEAELTDWKKMKEPRDASKPAPKYKKTYTVTVDEKTQFSANKLDSLKAGDTIQIASKELVYQTDKLTAVFIMSPSPLPAK
jgi:hypothetical protein